MTLPFAITLLGGILEDTDLLALAVLDHSGVHLRALHHGSAELRVLTIDDGQNLIVNEYTKDTTEIHSDGEQVHLSFDPMRISLYDKSEEVLSL
jgi:hypothetical protein